MQQNQRQSFYQVEFIPGDKKNVRSSQIFYNIADEDMEDFFVNSILEKEHEKDRTLQNYQKPPFLENAQDFKERFVHSTDKDNLHRATIFIDQHDHEKEIISRLQIEIKKHNLNFVPLYGEIFIMLVEAQLISPQKRQVGKLVITNYRFAFFRGRLRKLDLPYGYISQCKFVDKSLQIYCILKYEHVWRIKIGQSKSFNNIKIFTEIYLKVESIKNFYAFNYAIKYPQSQKVKHNEVSNELIRLGFNSNNNLQVIDNSLFNVSPTYPEILYLPVGIPLKTITKIGKLWNEHRFPILVFQHIKQNGQIYGSIWRSSYLVCDRNEDLTEVSKYYQSIKGFEGQLTIFDTGYKMVKKCLEQTQVFPLCQLRYLNTDSLSSIKSSYLALVNCFLHGKNHFMRDLLASKWYQFVVNYLQGASQIAASIVNKNSILIKCLDGKDKSAVFSALVQIIINPNYRTFEGFSNLVQKQFQFLGFPFRNRLGFNHKKQQEIPIFTFFLDCVSQLIYTNEMSFEFNYKYLSKLSNLMYTTIFGTFITNTRKEAIENNISLQTIPIWKQLKSEITLNAFYMTKAGRLQVPVKMDAIRIWRQHFWYLTTPPKESYKIHPSAEDNSDYLNLNCLKVMSQNNNLKKEITNQRQIIDFLKKRIKQKRGTQGQQVEDN